MVSSVYSLMRAIRLITVVILFCHICFVAMAQKESQHFKIHYVVDIADVDTTFMDNAKRIEMMRKYLRWIRQDNSLSLDSVKFSGTASPDGYYEYNNWLSENRLENLKKIMREEIEVPDSIIFRNDAYITWKMFRDSVAASNIPMRDSVLAILDMEPGLVAWWKLQSTGKKMSTDHRMLKIRAMNNGKVYESLKPILHNLRFADVEIVTHRKSIIDTTRLTIVPREIPPPTLDYVAPLYDHNSREWVRRIYIKNNLVKDALLIANISVETDLTWHWTLDLTMFYSNWDYFWPQTKFRMAGFQTELRYWFNPIENDGWFVGGHVGYSYYNMAFNGAHRYQDLYGETPTMGGGMSFGWRKQVGPQRRWRIELSGGAGVYPLHYSVFQNTLNYKKGLWLEERRKTFFGVDVLSVSVGYAIDAYKHLKRGKAVSQ